MTLDQVPRSAIRVLVDLATTGISQGPGTGEGTVRGGNQGALQQVMGYASIVTTQRYARMPDEVVMREAQRIGSAWERHHERDQIRGATS